MCEYQCEGSSRYGNTTYIEPVIWGVALDLPLLTGVASA